MYTTDRLGAPFAQHLQDFPVGDNRWSILVVRAIGLVEHRPYTVLNLYFLLGFGLVAAAAYLAARELGLRALPATVVAWLFAFLPYHFAHDETHVWLANYAGQPLAVLLAVWVLRGQLRLPVVDAHPAHGRATSADASWLRSAASCTSAVVVATPRPSRSSLSSRPGCSRRATDDRGGAPRPERSSPLGSSSCSSRTSRPELIWRATHGVDHSVAQRSLSDNQRFGLNLTQMVLPGPAHQVSFLAAIGCHAQPRPTLG